MIKRRISAAGLTVPKTKPPSASITAAGLTVPKRPPAGHQSGLRSTSPIIRSKADTAALFDRLRALLDKCGSNKNDAAIALITACIMESADTRPQIVGILGHLGFDKRHVALMLNRNAGDLPALHRWRRGPDGVYTLLG